MQFGKILVRNFVFTLFTWVDDKSFIFEYPYRKDAYSKYLIGTDGSHSEIGD